MGHVVKRFGIFRGKRVLVSGDTGFKGSWLCLWLSELGAEVLGYALPPERADDHFVLLKLEELVRHVDGDVRDGAHLERVFTEFRPQFAFHLAAQSLVLRSYQDPKTTFDTNVLGSVNLLEQARKAKDLRALVYVTSDKCYRNREWERGYRETDELGGRDPYSASKAAAEIVFGAYFESFFAARPDFGAASARAGNVIGGGDWAEDRIIPDAMRALAHHEPVVLRRPEAVRPWQHVLEPLSGYLQLADALARDPREYSGSWNFGPPDASTHTVRALAEHIVHNWGAGSIREQPDPDAPHEARLLSLNCEKAVAKLGWAPRWDFDHAVAATVDWYKQVAAGVPAREVSLTQIRAFEESLHD